MPSVFRNVTLPYTMCKDTIILFTKRSAHNALSWFGGSTGKLAGYSALDLMGCHQGISQGDFSSGAPDPLLSSFWVLENWLPCNRKTEEEKHEQINKIESNTGTSLTRVSLRSSSLKACNISRGSKIIWTEASSSFASSHPWMDFGLGSKTLESRFLRTRELRGWWVAVTWKRKVSDEKHFCPNDLFGVQHQDDYPIHGKIEWCTTFDKRNHLMLQSLLVLMNTPQHHKNSALMGLSFETDFPQRALHLLRDFPKWAKHAALKWVIGH